MEIIGESTDLISYPPPALLTLIGNIYIMELSFPSTQLPSDIRFYMVAGVKTFSENKKYTSNSDTVREFYRQEGGMNGIGR